MEDDIVVGGGLTIGDCKCVRSLALKPMQTDQSKEN